MPRRCHIRGLACRETTRPPSGGDFPVRERGGLWAPRAPHNAPRTVRKFPAAACNQSWKVHQLEFEQVRKGCKRALNQRADFLPAGRQGSNGNGYFSLSGFLFSYDIQRPASLCGYQIECAQYNLPDFPRSWFVGTCKNQQTKVHILLQYGSLTSPKVFP